MAFLSPCVLPLIPSYLSYLTGISFSEFSGGLTKERKRRITRLTVFHSLGFILGFSVVFVLLGASITFLGKLLFQYQPLLKRLGGILIIFFGLVIMGVIKLPYLAKEKKFSYKKEGISILGSLLVGAAFAAAWTPCVGPILGSILIYASSTASIKAGIKLLIAFSLGLGLPFFLSALLINSLLVYIKKIEKYIRWVTVAAGVILIIFGFLLSTAHAEYGKAIDYELQDINGNTVRLSDYSGKVIILNFFATWCPPCRREMPDFNEVAKEYKNDVEIIAIAVNDNLSKVQQFVKSNRLVFTVAMDDGRISSSYGPIRGIPLTFIIDRDFNIAKKHVGMMHKNVLISEFKELL